MEEKFSMEWNMEWKKIVNMEYGKIVFHLFPYYALTVSLISLQEIVTILVSKPSVVPVYTIQKSYKINIDT